jgi:hypothetical protein
MWQRRSLASAGVICCRKISSSSRLTARPLQCPNFGRPGAAIASSTSHIKCNNCGQFVRRPAASPAALRCKFVTIDRVTTKSTVRRRAPSLSRHNLPRPTSYRHTTMQSPIRSNHQDGTKRPTSKLLAGKTPAVLPRSRRVGTMCRAVMRIGVGCRKPRSKRRLCSRRKVRALSAHRPPQSPMRSLPRQISCLEFPLKTWLPHLQRPAPS